MKPSSPVVHAACLARSSSTTATCGTADAGVGIRQSLESIPGLGTVLADSMEDIWAELADLRELVESRLNPPTDANGLRNVAPVSPSSRRCLPPLAVNAAGAELRAVLDKRRARAEGTPPPIDKKTDSPTAANFSLGGIDKGEAEPERFSICDDEPRESPSEGRTTKTNVEKKTSRVSALNCSEPSEPPVPRRPTPPASEMARSVNEALLGTHGKIAGLQRDCNAQCSAIANNARELEEQIGEIGNDLAKLKTDIKVRLHTVARKCLDDQKRLGREMSEQIQATVETVESLDRTVSGLRSSVDQNRDDSKDGLSHCDKRLSDLEGRCVSLQQGNVLPSFSNMEEVHSAIKDISAACEQNTRLNHCLNGAMQSLRTALSDAAASSGPVTEVLHPTELSLVEKTRASTTHLDKCQ